MEFDVTSMPFIVLVVYFIVWCLKKWVFTTNETRTNLPPIAAASGCAIALLIYFRAPELANFGNVIDAATTGIGSGLAAVGCNQVYKQFQKSKIVTEADLNSNEDDVPVKEEKSSSNEAFDNDREGG